VWKSQPFILFGLTGMAFIVLVHERFSSPDHSRILQVLNPNGAYNGQKLIKLVSIKTPARMSKTIPSVPLTVPV